MKRLMRIGAILLVITMLAMSAGVLADTAGNDYQDDSQTTVSTSANTIPLTKSIVMFNLNSSAVYEPNITYTYSVAPVTDTAKLGHITDDGELNTANNNAPVTVKVNAGEADGVYFASGANTITYSSTHDAVNTDADGVEKEYSTNMTVDLSKFTHAGVYRYLITETDNSAAVTAAGMVRGADYSNLRYLDIYLSNGGTVDATTNPAGLRLTGAVIFKTNAQDETTPNKNNATDQITTTTHKTTGFEPGVGGDSSGGANIDYTSDTESDHYTTCDFTISKSVTGGLADKTHEFPFFVTVSNTINGAAYTYIKDTTGSEAPATATQDTTTTTKFTAGATTQTVGSDSASSALSLKDGESITFRGLPSNTTNALSVMVKEYNNSVDQYTASVKATVSGTANTAVATDPTNGVMTASTGTAALADDFDVKTNDVTGQVIAVENNLSEISPTGYVSRYAPYALILVGGIVLLIIAKKHKKHTEDEE